MNVPHETIKAAQEIIKADGNEKLFCALTELHHLHKKQTSAEEVLPFWAMVEVYLDHLAEKLKKDNITAEELVEAARERCMGFL